MAKIVPSTAVVIATNRPEAFKQWFEAWLEELGDTPVYVVEDAPGKSADLLYLEHVGGVSHYAWDDIDADLGEDSWIIPRRSSAIKSYGFLKAYQGNADVIWTLDDDCFPEEQFKGRYLPVLQNSLRSDVWKPGDKWFNTIADTGLYPRGYPYGIRHESQPVMIHHGLWSGVPDLDGITALEYPDLKLGSAIGQTEVVPHGRMFPMCGMNLAFRREMTPAMYFMLQGSYFSPERLGCEDPELLPFDRFDDIWAGLFAKKVTDHFGWSVVSGAPSIIHTKLSDPTMRVLKEAPGIAAHEILWKHVANWDMRGAKTVQEAYAILSNCVYHAQRDPVLKQWDSYWVKLSNAMNTWAGMF